MFSPIIALHHCASEIDVLSFEHTGSEDFLRPSLERAGTFVSLCYIPRFEFSSKHSVLNNNMAILNAESAESSQTVTPPEPLRKPPLFMRTIVPKGTITHAIPCSLLPPHALSRAHSSQNSPPSLKSCRQVVVSTGNELQVYAVDDGTLSLRPLSSLKLFTPIYDIAVVSSPVPGRDILVVLSAAAKITFIQFDDYACNLCCTGHFPLYRPTPAPAYAPRLMVTHPQRRLVAVAPFKHVISVFPVNLLPNQVAAGFVVSVDVDGFILSLAFLEDDDNGVVEDAILIALIQKPFNQYIEVFSIGEADSKGGLSIISIGSMVTCASRSEDLAVERNRSKLTGEPIRPVPSAVGVASLPGCPFQFAVFTRGKVIAADARNVILKHRGGIDVPTSVRLEDDVVHSRSPRYNLIPPSPPPLSRNSSSAPLSPIPNSSNPDAMRTPEGQMIPRPVSSEAQYSTPTGSDAGPSNTNDGYNTPIHARIRLETPAAPLQSRPRTVLRDDVIPISALSHRNLNLSDIANFKPGEDYLTYLYKPTHISLDTGFSNGVATAWVDAGDHFQDNGVDRKGLYFVLESGAMYSLQWSDDAIAGSTTFQIPITIIDEQSRIAARRRFCVEYIGDVGPTIALAPLDRRLLFVATDCFDASLRRVHLPNSSFSDNSLDRRRFTTNRRLSGRLDGGLYGLEVRQEFLNLSPISDMVLSSPRQEVSIRNPPRLSLYHRHRADGNTANVVHPHEVDDDRPQNALNRVLHGDEAEKDLIVCSGMGRFGSVRFIRPGSPVNVYASSSQSFAACNDMWSIRFSSDTTFDAAIVFSFAEATRMLLSVPSEDMMSDDNFGMGEAPKVANLIDGTDCSGLLATTRSIRVGLLQNGVMAQIHANGIRLVLLKAAADIYLSDLIINGILSTPFCDQTIDWSPPEGSSISVGAIRAGYIAVSIVHKKSMAGNLVLLKFFPGNPERELTVVSSMTLERELSSIEIPAWTTDPMSPALSSPQFPPMVILGTYEPSVEVRLLGPSLDLVCQRRIFPWILKRPKLPQGSNDTPPGSVNRSEVYANSTKMSKHERDIALKMRLEDAELMTAVPESLCALEFDGVKLLFAGLRDGSVIAFSFDGRKSRDGSDSDSPSSSQLLIVGHRKLGHRPVTLTSMACAVGPIVVGAAERPWMCTSNGGRRRWTPLAFTETRAICPYSVPGASRCFGAVAEDGAFYICGLRRNSAVSVQSIYIGATPRRVLSLQNLKDHIVVATSNEITHSSNDPMANEAEQNYHDPSASIVRKSELQLYRARDKTPRCRAHLMEWEYVHFLENWAGHVVVGTSVGNMTYYDAGSEERCKWGRLLLFMPCSYEDKNSSTEKSSISLELCSEVILPGAVLAGDVSKNDDILVVSCNQEVLVFTIIRPRSVLVEVARISARMLVVGLSIREDIVSALDQKDSICFFQLRAKTGNLVRDRSDHRRRTISDVVLVDRTLGFAVDRFGGFFSVGYEKDDDPPQADKGLRVDAMRLPLPRASRRTGRAGPGGGLPSEAGGSANVGNDEEFGDQSAGSDFDQLNESLDIGAGPTGPVVVTPVPANTIPPGFGGLPDPHPLFLAQQIVAGIPDEAISDMDFNDGNGDNDGDENDDAINDPGQDQGMQVVGNEGNNNNNENDGNDGNEDETEERNTIPRNLVSHHSFNMRDTALRVRLGSFCRAEQSTFGEYVSLGQGSSQKQENTVLCGTIGGAIVSAVGMTSESYTLLSNVERELSKQTEITGKFFDSNHKAFRALYGPSAIGAVDGDLLQLFEGLSYDAKIDVSDRVGCPGELGILYIEALIQDLCDRVA